jgi:Cys-tRNA(Pro)/Cys-tRNA(Cys) deacylase
VPVEASLDLKKAAKAAGEKSIEMLHLKELFPLTGYVHGGCSPLGMKKKFPTVFDETCILYDTIYVSAGKIGFQVEAAPGDLIKASEAITADIITED